MMGQETFVATAFWRQFPNWTHKADYKVVNRVNAPDALQEIIDAQFVAWDSEFEHTTSGHVPHAYQFSTKPGTGWFLPVGMEHITNIPDEITKRFLRAISLKENVVQRQEAERRTARSHFGDEFEQVCRIDHDIQILWYLRELVSEVAPCGAALGLLSLDDVLLERDGAEEALGDLVGDVSDVLHPDRKEPSVFRAWSRTGRAWGT